jgi:hypothetical protein
MPPSVPPLVPSWVYATAFPRPFNGVPGFLCGFLSLLLAYAGGPPGAGGAFFTAITVAFLVLKGLAQQLPAGGLPGAR